MKPFNMEDAVLGRPVRTRDGEEVNILSVSINSDFPVVGVIISSDVGDLVHCFTQDGKFTANDDDHPLDLMLETIKKTGWINLYHNDLILSDSIANSSRVYPTKEIATAYANDDLIATVQVEWEE